MKQRLIYKDGLYHDDAILILEARLDQFGTVHFQQDTTPKGWANHTEKNYAQRRQVFGQTRYPRPTRYNALAPGMTPRLPA